MSGGEVTLEGIGVSSGITWGPLVRVNPPVPAPENEAAETDVAAAVEASQVTFKAVAQGLKERAEHADKTAKPILEATALIASDPGLANAVKGKIEAGTPRCRAVHQAVEEFCAQFEAIGGYMAERTTDLRNVRDRVIARLLGLEEPGLPEFTEPSVLTAVDLAPADTAVLDPQLVVAILTEEGGPTSHTAIIAAQLGIPAIVKVTGISEIPAGTVVAIDGGVGEVIVAPSAKQIKELEDRRARRAAALGKGTGAGSTRDGYPVALLANIGTVADAEAAAATSAEGCGLFRTEFLYMGRETPPSVQEQTEIYTKVLKSFGERRVVVRTMDAGADKPLAFADLGPEENPALGRRGIRLNKARPDLLDTQLDALAAAHAATGADLRVMAPMIATVEEANWFAQKARDRGLPSVGVMVEVPSTALRSRDVLAEVDFASIGTNDLGQYCMATDRMQGELAELLDPWQPALLDLIASTCDGATISGAKVGVCGEAAGNPALALVLVGLGVASLSMATSKLTAVRTALSLHKLVHCQEMAAAARAAKTASEARQAVLDLADPILLDLI